MRKGKRLQELFRGMFWGFFLGLALVFGSGLISSAPVFAEQAVDSNETTTENDEATEEETTTESEESTETTSTSETTDSCQDSLGSIGWIVCPTTGKVAEAVDWLYEKIEGILAIDPVEAEDGQPIYEIWKYCRSITNIVFIIFMLVAIYSQLTGVGLSNYGLKRSLPKLIVAAILVNLSFLICSLAVDASNIIGAGLRGIFENVEEMVVANMNLGTDFQVSELEVYSALIGGTALAIGGAVIAFETGAIWMLIPVLLGAIVAVATGLITIALRQAVVALLIMISPLAFVCYILPNTEKWFRQWKNLLFQMLVFYPAFSLLFGASQLAGFAIILSASDGFFVLLGIAVQIFPLFFSWKLMKMSGNFLGTINGAMNRIAMGPLNRNRAWADSHRMLSKQRHLASGRAATPSLRLMQFVNNRRIAREADIADQQNLAKTRALARRAERNYDRNGAPSRRGERVYREQAEMLEYQRTIERDKNNMNKGLTMLAASENVSKARKKRFERLDTRMVQAADNLKYETARGEYIDYDNAKGFYERTEKAINAGMDEKYGYSLDENGKKVINPKYKLHAGVDDAAKARYQAISQITEGEVAVGQYVTASAARGYDTQKKIVENTYQKYFEMLPPTKDLEYRLSELTKMSKAADYIDTIIPGLRVLNQRGDTDVTLQQIENVLNGEGGVQLGTHASQALASFLMFEVKDSDPFMRRFGKYLNLETARIYNSNDRKAMNVSYEEYIRGYHTEPNGEMMYAKKGMKELMEGTSLDNIERTALSNFDDSLRKAYQTSDGKLDVDGYFKKRDEIQTAIGPQFISASMKFLSGSEQLRSSVKFLTGFDYKQKKENGKNVLDENGEPVYYWEPIWEKDAAFENDKEKAKKYFGEKTLRYLGDQTPSQILGLRSDYRDPLMEHLMDAYEADDDMEGWSEEDKADRREYMEKVAEIQTRYGDLPDEEARERREADRKALRKEFGKRNTGVEFRQLLDAKGKLNQIYRTRRSGAANNAKDWVREWLDLDNEIAVTRKLENDRQKLKQQEEAVRREAGQEESGGDSNPIYSEVDRAEFVSYVDDLWQNLRDEDDETFFNESLKYVEGKLGHGSYIAKEYKRFRKEDPYADSHMLKEFLNNLLSDEENY